MEALWRLFYGSYQMDIECIIKILPEQASLLDRLCPLQPILRPIERVWVSKKQIDEFFWMQSRRCVHPCRCLRTTLAF